MGYLPMVMLLCLLGLGRSADDAAVEGNSSYGEESEGTYPTRRPSSTEPMPMRQMFGLGRWDIYDVVNPTEDEGGAGFEYHDWITRLFKEDIIPELCYLTSENITIYNSFLLDSTCLAEFESVSLKCRGFKCDLAHYLLEHGARIFTDFFNAPTVKDGIEVVKRELSDAFEKLDMCTCGREFFKAAFKCAPFYYSNVLYYGAAENDEVWMFNYGKMARNVDLKSASRLFDRLMTGLCAPSSSGRCLDSIFDGFLELTDLVENTMDQYDDYDDGDRKYQKSLEKRCDNMFASLRGWQKGMEKLDQYKFDDDWQLDETTIELFINSTAAATKGFYCVKGCRKDSTREAMYPCCMRRMLEDEKMWDNAVRVIESVYRALPAIGRNFEWVTLYEFYSYDYSKEELADIQAWTVSERFRNSFMRSVHAAKYCEGKIVKCSE